MSYRSNVAAILRRPSTGKILIFRRKDHPECWQFPQGGVDRGEDLLAALYREVEEEIGVTRDRYELVACRTGYRYRFAGGRLKKGKFFGQEQTYFLLDFEGKKKEMVFDHPGSAVEFTDARWIFPKDFPIGGIPRFKKQVFRQVMKDFFNVSL